MAFPLPYTESGLKSFDYERDWKEHAEDTERSSSHFDGDNQQESLLIGYTPWESRRACLRFFKGFAWADKAAPWLLHREQPHRHPDFPWLRCDAVTFGGKLLKPNENNPNYSPYDESDWSEDRRTRYWIAETTLRYRSFKNCFFGEDEDIATPDLEWQRNTIIDPPTPLIEALTISGGLSQMTFAESGTDGPTAGETRFTAPLAERQLKLAFRLLWLHVPWDYLSESETFFLPTRLMEALGKVNRTACFVDGTNQFDPEVLYLGGLSFNIFPWWVPSDDLSRPLMGVNVMLDYHWFDPPNGKSGYYSRGHNNLPWSGNGVTNGDALYYYATRNGNLPDHPTAPGRPFIDTYEFNDLWKHVKDV